MMYVIECKGSASYNHVQVMKRMDKRQGNKAIRSSEIPEGEGRLPWWIWLAALIWLIYAFLIGPFDLLSPAR